MDQRLGKYVLEERLGIGGMAEVFKARLEGPGGFKKDLAVKTILPQVSEDPEFLSLFMKEARLSALLDHNNIVRVYDFDRADDRYYIAMEYVDGQDLLSVISCCREMYRPLRVPEVLLIGLEICRGLAYAHGELTPGGHVVLHRDISPQNVLLSRAGEVKITDFGIAKMLSGIHYTNTGRVIGKDTYMSPEQARCEELDRRADVFSAGCVLWELLTCQKLFDTPTASLPGQVRLGGIVGKDIPVLDKALEIKPPSTHNKDVPEALDRLVLRALERDRNRRIESATDLGSGLEDVLASCPGVCRSTDLSELYRHLFSGEEQNCIEAKFSAETRAALPAKAEKEIQEPPTLHVKPVSPKKQCGRVRRWAVPVLAVVLASLISTAAAWQHSPVAPAVQVSTSTGLELVGQEARQTSQAILGSLEPARVGSDRLPTGNKVPMVLEMDSEPQKGKTRSAKRNPQAETSLEDGKKRRGNNSGSGWLSINAIPWADVYWNGKFLGETPLERIKMPVGKHNLVLINNCVGDNKTVKVEIRKGKLTTKVVDLLK